MERAVEKKARFPVFRERLLELRGAMDNTSFAKFLGMSRQTIGFYLNGDRIPDALGVKQIAEKCNVSADWLLGISDSKSRDADIQNACRCTGLSDITIETMSAFSSSDETTQSFVKRYIEDIIVDQDIRYLSHCIANAAFANAISEKHTSIKTI